MLNNGKITQYMDHLLILNIKKLFGFGKFLINFHNNKNKNFYFFELDQINFQFKDFSIIIRALPSQNDEFPNFNIILK